MLMKDAFPHITGREQFISRPVPIPRFFSNYKRRQDPADQFHSVWWDNTPDPD